MRKLRNYVVWTLIAAVIEFSLFYYVDNNNFKSVGSYKETPIVVKKASQKFKISIPNSAAFMKMSDDGNYISYYVDGNLKVADTSNGNANDVQPASNATIALTSWAPGADMLLIVEKSSDSSGTYMKLYSYNAGKKEKTETIANDTKKIAKIAVSRKSDKIVDASLLSQTGSFYLKIATAQNNTEAIYRVNVMNEPQIVDGTEWKTNIGKINQFKLDEKSGDLLVYEDTNKNKVKVEGRNSINLPDVEKQCLLSVDDDNNIYIGSVVDNKVTQIYYGTYQTSASKWQSIKLDSPADASDIFINNSGKIYTVDNLKGIVTDTSTKKTYKFKGTFVQIYDDGVASLDDGKLVNILFK